MYTGNMVQAWFEEHNSNFNVLTWASVSADLHQVDGDLLDILQITGSAAQIWAPVTSAQFQMGLFWL